MLLILCSYIRSRPEPSEAFSIGMAGHSNGRRGAVFLFMTSPTAAYPDGHSEGVHNDDQEIEHLKAKVESGADFIVIANLRRRQLPSMVTEDPPAVRHVLTELTYSPAHPR